MGSGGKKKKNIQTLTLSEFQTMSFSEHGDNSSWVDTSPLPSAPSIPSTGSSGSQLLSSGSYRSENVTPVDMSRLPISPPFTAYIGNLPFDIEKDEIVRAFPKCLIVTVKLVRDKVDEKLKGHGYVEFENLDSLKMALNMNGILELKGRRIRIDISESLGRSSSSSTSLSKDYGSRSSNSSFEIYRRTDPISNISTHMEKTSFHSHRSSNSFNEIEITRRTEPVKEFNYNSRDKSFFNDGSTSEIVRRSESLERPSKSQIIPEITRRQEPVSVDETTFSSDRQFTSRPNLKAKSKFFTNTATEGSWRSSSS